MAADRNRRAGLIWVQVNGQRVEAKGTFTINAGQPLRSAITGADGIHGYAETPQVSSVEGALTDNPELDTVSLRQITNATVTVELNNGKTWVFEDAWFAGEGAMTTDESEIAIRFESRYAATEMR